MRDDVPEEIIDKYGNIYKESLAEKTMITENEESKKILSLTRKIYLNELRFHNKIKNFQYFNEIYIISIEWFNKFKEYSNYKLIKRISRNLDLYLSKKQIIYKLDSNKFPGKITNESLIITSDTNILSSDYYFVKDDKKEKIDFKIFPKESFDILNEEFGCDYIIKSQLIEERETNLKKYNIYSKKFFVTFIPVKNSLIQGSKINTYEIYIPVLLTEEHLFQFLSDILNNNKTIKKNLGISMINSKLLKFFIKIYRLPKDNKLKYFKDFIYENIENLKEDKRILGSYYLQKIPEKFQINQLQYNNLLIEFSYNKNGELFDYIINDNDIDYINKESVPRNKISNTQNKYFLTEEEKNNLYLETKEERRPKRKKSSPKSYFFDRKTELRKQTLDKNDNKHGLVGLRNIGNTCYMNTSLQCLSNCNILTNYFLEDTYKQFINENNPIGSQGKLVEAYSELIKHLWYGQEDSIEPYGFKETIGDIRTMFRGYQQQDTQEFLSFLLDGLHEDLNKVLNKPYTCPEDDLTFENNIEEFKYYKRLFLARNQSLIVDLFYGMFKSTLFCPNSNCLNISNTYDPYAIISLPFTLKTDSKMNLTVFFIYENVKFKVIKFNIEINRDTTIRYFREKINYLLRCGLNTFEIYLVQNGNELKLIDERKYVKIVDFLGDENTIFLNQISSYIFGKENSEIEKTYNEIRCSNLLFDRIKEFDQNEGKIEDFEQIEETYDKSKYIRCLFYNFSYNIGYMNEYQKSEYPPKDSFLFPRVFYFNIEWNNSQIFNCLLNYYRDIYDREEEDNFKEKYFEDYEENSQKVNETQDFNFTYSIHETYKYPFVIIFLKNINAFNQEEENLLMHKSEENNILEISENKYIIKENIEKINFQENESIKDYQLNFKIAWLPEYAQRLNDYNSMEKIEKRTYWYHSDDDEPDLNLLDLLENFNKKEKLTEENKWYCPKCKEHQLAEKKMEIFTCPEILILHLKRFKNNSKLGNTVNFPIEGLDMGKYITYNEIETSDNIYDLFAVANHFGGLHGGHYIAYCKNDFEKKWYEFNDSYVSEIDENKIVSKSAYVLFYKKRNTYFPNIQELYQKTFEEIDFKMRK
jgi:ubiquitin C-terminal hydrolase